MYLSLIIIALGLSFLHDVLANPLPGAPGKRYAPVTHSVHERHNPYMARHWSKGTKIAGNVVLPMRIGLKQRNLDAGHDRLMSISDPASQHFGKQMTPEEVIDFFAPDRATIDAVTNWLIASGVSRRRISQSANKQWIQFDISASQAEDLLITDFYIWQHESGGQQNIACEQYHVPVDVQPHVDYITPGVRLREPGKVNLRRIRRRQLDVTRRPKESAHGIPYPGHNSTTCDVYVTADCVQAQYSITKATTAVLGNELGVFEGLDSHYSTKDLDLFFKDAYPGLIPPGTYPINRLIDGAIGSAEDVASALDTEVDAGGEANLDFEAAMPLIYPQQTVLFQTDDEFYETHQTIGFLNTFLDAIDGSYCSYGVYNQTGNCTEDACVDPIYPDPYADPPLGYKGQLQCGVYKPTNVISISYGGLEHGHSTSYQKRQCNEFLKLGLQGVTVVLSSGDSGVGPRHGSCIGPCDGEEDKLCKGSIFTPAFPATCPYVLTVGATELDRTNPNVPPKPYEKLNEVAVARFPSGGGFSNIYGVPSYQRKSVQKYYDQMQDSFGFKGYHSKINDNDFSRVNPNQLFHHGGRGYPDVSIVGDRQLMTVNGLYYREGGTSMSAPIWASILTLINEKRLAANKKSLGFIHPILYAHPEVFNDVTVGSNPNCGTDGFPAAEGWDPVTGLGSPNYPALEALLLSI